MLEKCLKYSKKMQLHILNKQIKFNKVSENCVKNVLIFVAVLNSLFKSF